MLQESIITLVLDKESLDVKNKINRGIVTGAFRIYNDKLVDDKTKWKGDAANNKGLTEKIIYNSLIKDLSSNFAKLTEKRNLINHAGFNYKSSDRVFKRIEKDLKEINDSIKNTLRHCN